MTITPDELDRWQKVLDSATQPRPWEVRGRHGSLVLDANGMWVADVGDAPKDAHAIALAVNEMPRAIARIRELERELSAYRKAKQENDERFMIERDRARADLDAANREIERWRHGVTVEGDFVCPDSVALAEARAEADRMREVYAAAVEWRNARCACGDEMPEPPTDDWQCPADRAEEKLRAALANGGDK